MFKNNEISNYKGFTLIELLVVIVIIGILTAITVPVVGEYKQRAYISSMKSDINSIRSSQELYYNDHDEYLVISPLITELVSCGFVNFSSGNSAEITSSDNGATDYTITVSSSKTSKEVIFSSLTGLITVE